MKLDLNYCLWRVDMDIKQKLIKSAMQKLNPDEINALGLS